MTYDFKTPKRLPNEADFAAPTQFITGRNESYNIEAQVKWWLEQKIPGMKWNRIIFSSIIIII